MIALLIILYLLIGLVVGSIVYWKELGAYGFEESIEDMEIADFWLIFGLASIWPIVLIGLGLPALFRFIILTVIKLIEDKRDDNTN